MRAWIKHDGRLQLREAPDPVPRSNELLVRVDSDYAAPAGVACPTVSEMQTREAPARIAVE